MPAPTQDSIRTWKSFQYRGGTRLWSNRYYLRDAVLAGNRSAAVDAVVSEEKKIYGSEVTIVKGEYMVAGSDVPVVSNAYTTAGTLAITFQARAPGDCAAVLRFATTQKTSKNHPIYLFNYFHAVWMDSATVPDPLAALQKTAIEAFGQEWVTGLTYGGGVGILVRSGPRGAVAQSRIVEQYIGHRDFT